MKDDLSQVGKSQEELAADAVANLVNPIGFDPDKFAEYMCRHQHRTLQQNFMRCVWACLKVWARDSRSGMFDLRNAATVSAASSIVERFGVNEPHFPFV